MHSGSDMRVEHYEAHKLFQRGVVMLSFDTEQMWGYFDQLNEPQFQSRYPGAIEAHEKLLNMPVRSRP